MKKFDELFVFLAEEEAQVEEEFPAEPIQHEDMDLLKEELVSLIEKGNLGIFRKKISFMNFRSF